MRQRETLPARSRLLVAACALMLAAQAEARNGPPADPAASIPTVSAAAIGRVGSFYVGGQYVGEPGQETMHGAMYVQVMVPKRARQAEAVVLLHGMGQTGSVWLQTPDGRPGWAFRFLEQGYVVYVVDLPGRGRSAYSAALDGPLAMRSVPQLERDFTNLSERGDWPEAKTHSQWPGSGPDRGKKGDPVFDAFARSQGPYPQSGIAQTVVDAGLALLDRIETPVVLVAHSMGAAYAWSMADARPGKVSAILALEPAGPPNVTNDAPPNRALLRWGPTSLPLHYEPEAASPGELQTAPQEPPGPTRTRCTVQAGVPRKLPNLAATRALVVTASASYHVAFDACTAHWLRQAGMPADFVDLKSAALPGNGHMMMIERNSDDIFRYALRWLRSKPAAPR